MIVPMWFGMPHWATSSPTQTATTSIYHPFASIWQTPATTSTSYIQTSVLLHPLYQSQQAQAWLAQEHAYNEAYNRATGAFSGYDACAPAVIRREQGRRDAELYARAVREHDVQEQERLARQIAARLHQSEEERRLMEERAQAAREVQQRDEAAKVRAHALLLEHLTPEQRETFKRNGWFIVQGGRSGTRYRIRSGSMAGNVDVLQKERVTHRLCAHVPIGHVPLGDQLLAQKIMLELAEDDFLRKANRHAA
jgi:hypothetical protein